MSRCYARQNISDGPQMPVSPRVRSLRYDIANMRLGRHSIGTEAWWQSFWRQLDFLAHPELEEILQDQENALRLRSVVDKRGKQTESMRVKRVIGRLRDSPREHVSFVTVVTDIALTKEDALAMLKATGRQLDRFIRNRFDGAIWLMYPEVDAKLARDIADNLVTHRNWCNGVPGNRLVFKVHFHGILYTPGMSHVDVEKAFKTGRNGKRTKLFSGLKQVRAIEMRKGLGGAADVAGVSRYATKCHFKPPVKTRMLEGAAEWVWLTIQIMSDDGLIKIGGVNGPHHKTPPISIGNVKVCEDASIKQVPCSPTSVINTYSISDDPDECTGSVYPGSIKYLNSAPATYSERTTLSDPVEKISVPPPTPNRRGEGHFRHRIRIGHRAN
ncbi:hypothetical protein PhaeoP88_03474 [Phaeobacter inhibens]|uniref:Uncharacterized protein n=2 Tax=Phaeobacter inhibens TaxID=221822 RepID=A0A2I7KDV5_9RHOB|nr:hypothetical protein PhaeoP88_03474 [Phaeobacter inhibens]